MEQALHVPADPLSAVLSELSSLRLEWMRSGHDPCVASEILSDIQAFRECVPSGACLPEIEIDPDDGFISLRWLDHQHTKSVTATFFGANRVIVTFSALDGSDFPARELDVQNTVEVS